MTAQSMNLKAITKAILRPVTSLHMVHLCEIYHMTWPRLRAWTSPFIKNTSMALRYQPDIQL